MLQMQFDCVEHFFYITYSFKLHRRLSDTSVLNHWLESQLILNCCVDSTIILSQASLTRNFLLSKMGSNLSVCLNMCGLHIWSCWLTSLGQLILEDLSTTEWWSFKSFVIRMLGTQHTLLLFVHQAFTMLLCQSHRISLMSLMSILWNNCH